MNEAQINIKEHVLSRHMNLSVHKCWFDYSNCIATFPLWNLSGKLSGYQSYRPLMSKKQKNDPKGKYYTYRLKDTVGIWGLESWNFSNTLFITEGIFDACRITNNGYSAIALLSNNPSRSTKSWLYMIRSQRPTFAVCDNGPSGNKLKSIAHNSYTMSIGDLGDANESFVKKLIMDNER